MKSWRTAFSRESIFATTLCGESKRTAESRPAKPQLHAFILEILSQIEFAQRTPAAEGQQFSNEATTWAERSRNSKNAPATSGTEPQVQTLQGPGSVRAANNSQRKTQAFAFEVLDCLFPNAQVRDNIAFASSLFQQLRNIREFEETATTVVDLLRSLLSCEVPHVVETCVTNMLAFGAQLRQAAQLCLFFIPYRQATGRLVRTWMAIMEESNQQVRDIDTAATLLEMGLQDCLYNSVYLFSEIARIGVPEDPAITREVHSVLRDSVLDRELLSRLLTTAVAVSSGAEPLNSPPRCLEGR